MWRNKASQLVYLYAVDASGNAKTGDAANISLRIRKDAIANAAGAGTVAEVDATNMPGAYTYAPTQAETDCEVLYLYPKSITAGVALDPIEIRTRQAPLPTATVVTDVGNTASTFKTDLTEAITDFWKDAYFKFNTGALAGQVKKISAYNGTTKFLTFSTAFTAAPAVGDIGEIVNK